MRWAVNSMTGFLTRRGHRETQMFREGGHVTVEAEIRMMQLQAKVCYDREPPGTSKRQERQFQRARSPANRFQASGIQDYERIKFAVWNIQFVIICYGIRETNTLKTLCLCELKMDEMHLTELSSTRLCLVSQIQTLKQLRLGLYTWVLRHRDHHLL